MPQMRTRALPDYCKQHDNASAAMILFLLLRPGLIADGCQARQATDNSICETSTAGTTLMLFIRIHDSQLWSDDEWQPLTALYVKSTYVAMFCMGNLSEMQIPVRRQRAESRASSKNARPVSAQAACLRAQPGGQDICLPPMICKCKW